MAYKSNIQPLCRACGKPIKKHTDNVSFGDRHRVMGDERNRDVFPKSKEEAQRHVNGKIVAVQWAMKDSRNESERRSDIVGYYNPDYQVRDYINRVSTWDGESYVDDFFCNRTKCAVDYAYMTVQSPHNRCQSVAYADALASQTKAAFKANYPKKETT